MEPFSMMLMMGAGIGLQLFGANKTNKASKQFNQAQVAEIGLENQVQDQQRQAMHLDARRKSLENLRRTQQVAAMAQAAGTNQGAQFGSGLQGGLAEIQDSGAWNEQGIFQNLQIGENIFGLNSQISQQKIKMANAQQGMQTGAGYSSLGNSLFNSSQQFGRLASGWGPQSNKT